MTLLISRFDLWRDSTVDGTGNFDPAVDKGAQADFWMYGEFVYQGLPASNSGIFICNGNSSVSLGIVFDVSGADVFAQPYFNNIRAGDWLVLPTMTVGQTYRICFTIPGAATPYGGKQFFTGIGVGRTVFNPVNGGFDTSALTLCEVGKGYYSTAFNGTAVKFGWGHTISEAEALDLVATGVSATVAAPDAPTDLVVSAQTATTMTLTATAAVTGGAATSWELSHSPDGTTWTALASQASNVWNVTYSGVSGHDHWRVRAVNATAASGWYSEVIGFSNPGTGGGGELNTTATAPTITSANSASGATGAAFSFTPAASGSSPITWAITTLPAGLTLNTSTGAVTGTLPAAGAYSWTYTASNGTLPNATQSFSLTVAAGLVIALSPASLSMITGESRQIVVSVTNGGVPVSGRTCPASVTSGPATITTPAATNSDGQTAFTVTATGAGRIEVEVT